MGVEKFSPEIRQRFLGAGLSRAPVDLQVYNEVKIILSSFSENLPSLSVCLGGSLHCWMLTLNWSSSTIPFLLPYRLCSWVPPPRQRTMLLPEHCHRRRGTGASELCFLAFIWWFLNCNWGAILGILYKFKLLPVWQQQPGKRNRKPWSSLEAFISPTQLLKCKCEWRHQVWIQCFP